MSDKVAMSGRVIGGVWKRLRRAWLRVRFPRAKWGRGCDVRSGLRLHMGPRGQLRVEPEVVLDHDATIECLGRLHIGARTIFGHHCTLAAVQSVIIGEDCLLAEMVSIRDHDHCFDDLATPIREQGAKVATVEIGRNVWLGAKVTVTKGVCIGDNAVVGANAVVTKDIPANAIAVGIPARVIRMRDGA